VELAVQTAVDACEAEAGRARPFDSEAFRESRTGSEDGALEAALEAAEREAADMRPTLGDGAGESGPAANGRRTVDASVDGAHALAVPMHARLGSRSGPRYVGVISIARGRGGFTRQEEELLEYLASQAVVSIENADLHETVRLQAVTDELTGLSNRRELVSTLDREIERSRRFGSPLGLLMLDIDDFKQVNDEYGHPQGDEVLAAVAQVLRDHSRDIDVTARYGGEELAVVLPETATNGAAQVAERMREAIEELDIRRVDGNGYMRVTASFGVASIPASAVHDRVSLIKAADGALYYAKAAGKNTVEVARPVPASS
jgi:diguanylate cyclase (GGDEF)-like protein